MCGNMIFTYFCNYLQSVPIKHNASSIIKILYFSVNYI